MNVLYVFDNDDNVKDYVYDGNRANLSSLTRGAGSCNNKLYDVVKFIDGDLVKDKKKLNEHQELLCRFLLDLKIYKLVHENTIYI